MSIVLFCFRSWHKGRTAEGNTVKLEGRVWAADGSSACDKVDKLLRRQHPTIRWMQGGEIEDDAFNFGPTTQRLKSVPPKKACGACGKPLKRHDDTSCESCGATDFET